MGEGRGTIRRSVLGRFAGANFSPLPSPAFFI
jgi:hypothetical protein